MAQLNNMKSKALGKDEVICLLDLISKQPALTSKATNATNNKLKDDAWRAIAHDFSAIAGEMRRPEQLRLKWENLKKAARKRNAIIRENNVKTGGGKMYIPPDEALDRVASILGATCSGFTVEFGGDREPGTVVEIIDLGSLPNTGIEKDNGALVEGGSGGFECGGGEIETNFTPKKHFLFNTPRNSVNKRRKLSEEVQRARRDKDLALAAYFQAKADNVNLSNVKLKLEIEKMKNNVQCDTSDSK